MKISVFLFLILATPCFAGAKNGKPAKVIDFEGDVIEGMNKQPLDNLTDVAEAKHGKERPHLYRKRKGFRTENRESLRGLGYLK